MGDRSAEFTPVIMTREMMERYLGAIETSGRKVQTIRGYRKSLADFYDFLPEDKQITSKALEEWRDRLKGLGYSDNTVSMRMSAASGFLKYCGVKKAAHSRRWYGPEMERSEYLRFISTARKVGNEQGYLLVRVFASIDIGVLQLVYLTVEACREGWFDLPNGRRVTVPEVLGEELLQYAESAGITSGTVFLSRNGNPMDRSNISRTIRELALKADMPPEKCCPQALRRMYRTAREEDLFAGASEDDLQHLDREDLIEKIRELQKELELCRAG